MSTAFDKNAAAINAITKNEDSLDLIRSSRIGICSEGCTSKSGELIAKALGEYMGRFWHNLDAIGSFASIIINSASESSKACSFTSVIKQRWEPPYDFIIRIGTPISPNEKDISIGADGWRVNAGSKAHTSNDPNPVGPCFAAALASAQAFKSIFQEHIQKDTCLLPPNYEWNSWYGNTGDGPQATKLVFDEIHVFGVGAVSHGFFWILQNWPEKIHGTIHLIDHDYYDAGNSQRYMGMTADWIGKPKSEAIIPRLKQIHPDLNIVSHKLDMNRYFAQENRQCRVRVAICGLDSKDSRRRLALKLPEKIINMWTSEEDAGATRFFFTNNLMCLYCAYPEAKDGIPDEVGMIYEELKHALKPSRLRELLYSGAGINEEEAAAVRKKTGRGIMSGMPIRSVRSELCAMGRLKPQNDASEVVVPLAFVSGIAGILGFIEAFREINHIQGNPGRIQISTLHYPTDYIWIPQSKNKNCYLCSDDKVLELVRRKYHCQ